MAIVLSFPIEQSCRIDHKTTINQSNNHESLYYIECPQDNSCEEWLAGGFLDTNSSVLRDYTVLFSLYSIDSLRSANVIERLYPRSSQEFNYFYDSLKMASGERKLFFYKIYTLFLNYATNDSAGCFQQLLNMTKFIDPRRTDIDWIAELELEIYYCVIPSNLQKFKCFYDTCNKKSYYSLPEWCAVYNSMIMSDTTDAGRGFYRYDTVQIEQQWKKYLTGERDISYLKACIPNNDVKPMNDCNYDHFVIICDDGAVIRLNTIPIIPSTIEPYIIKDYGDTITKSFGNAYLGVLQKEYFNRYISGFPKDSSLYKPEPIVLEGVDKNGMCWKLIRIEYICISYENVIPERKDFYNSVINEYKLLNDKEVSNYRHLPLYQ